MKKKIFAVAMAAVMTLSMVACGETQTDGNVTETPVPTETTAPTEAPQPTETPAPAAENVTIEGASINFEDGNMGFADAYTQHATSANLELSIADFNGSKALKVVNKNNKSPWVAFDLASLLGADITKVAKVEMVIGTEYADGSFYATSGEILSWWGEDLNETKLADWSVYMAKKNPKVISAEIPAGCEFVADANNILLVSLRTDNGLTDTGVPATVYIDDVCFYDAAGNILTVDTSVEFNWPETSGEDNSNLFALSNAVEFEGFATSGDGWGQNGFEMPQEFIDALVPGTVVEIEFSSEDNTMWIVMPWAEAGWMRIAQGEAYINNSGTKAQIPYEKFVELLGEDKATWGAMMQCEAQTAWEVYSVKVGTASQRVGITNAVEFEGFATSGDGWGQNGFEMPQEIIDALVPGSVIEIDYTSEDGTLWIVMPWAEAGWMRCAQGTAVCDGSKCYVTYEQIEEMCGTDKATWGAMMQCESQTKWEVYGLRVGTAITYPAISGLTAFDGYATSGDGWGQNGAEMSQELLDALVPGSVIEISFSSEDNTMWIVMPWAEAGWMRCAQGTAAIADGKAYVTYEQIAEMCGEDKATWGAMMQFEAQTAWEVYGIRVGKYATLGAASTETPDAGTEEPAAEPVADPLASEYAGDYGVGFTVSVDDLKAIDGDVVVTLEVATMTTYPYWQMCFIDYSDGWNKLTAADFSADAPALNDWGFADVTDGTITTTISKDAVAKIVANGGGLASQVYGVVVKSVKVSAAGAAATKTPEETAPAAEGTAYELKTTAGDWGAYTNCIPVDAFANCTNGATIVVEFTQETADYYNLTLQSSGTSWQPLKDYVTSHTFNDWGFIDTFEQGDTSMTLTLNADGVAKIVSDGGGLLFQVYALNVTKATVIPQ